MPSPHPTPVPLPPTVRELLAEFWRELTQLDSRVWRTLRGLLCPGLLAREWSEGSRGAVFPPIRLYLVASALYFFAGGDPLLASLVKGDLVAHIPEGSAGAFDVGVLRGALENEVMGWVAVLRSVTVLPVGFALALFAPGPGARVAPAMVLAMHWFVVGFLLVVVLGGLGLLFPTPEGTLAAELAGVRFTLERATVALWLILALRRIWGASWTRATAAGLAVTALDSLFLMFSFAIASGILEAGVGG